MNTEQDRATTPGTALLEVVAVMDRLRSAGGCPWDAEQTHESLTRYLVEETYEVLDAVEALSLNGDHAGEADLAEELGDVLLQVVFHARVATERGAFDIDDVARKLVAKLVRRHPHVFSDESRPEAAAVQSRWDELKEAEKPHRGPVDGIPRLLPALARADKLLARLERAGLPVPAAQPSPEGGSALTSEHVGDALFALVRTARESGVDPEAALRAHVGRVESATARAADPAH